MKINNSRTHNVVRNIVWAVTLNIIAMILQFVSRTIFISYLSKEYLGINGLFMDMFAIINLADLGIGFAITLNMYKPLAENDTEKLRSLMHLSGKIHIFIGFIVLAFSLLVMLALPFLIKNPPDIPESFRTIFLLYLLENFISYFLFYKRSILQADQKEYILDIYYRIFHFIQLITQIFVLIFTRQFLLYLTTQFVCSTLMHLMIARKAEKMYPYLRQKITYKLKKEELSEIISNVKSTALYRAGAVALLGTDSIIVSTIVGIDILGLCSNYTLIVLSIKTLTDKAMTAFSASIGNLQVNADKESSEIIFNQVFFISFFLLGSLSVSLAVCLNNLVSLWLNESFVLSQWVVISLVLRFYIQGTQYAPFAFRSTSGLLKYNIYIPVITAVVNISLSFVLGYTIGVSGVFFASSIAVFFFTIIPEVRLLYKYKFKKNPMKFFIRYAIYLSFIVLNYTITNFIINKISFNGWTGFLIKMLFSAFISFTLFIIFFHRDQNFLAVYERIKYIINDFTKKNNFTEDDN